MRKNKTMRIAAILFIAVLLSTCVISGTFAKYTSTASADAKTTVAKWSIQAMGDEIAAETPTVSFGLFDTINDTGDAEVEGDVTSGLIAPGTAGHFDVKVKNNSEVTAKYTITLTETNESNIPLQYSLDGTEWKDSVAELTVTGLKDQSLAIGADEVTHTVYWRWVFEGTTSGAHAGQTDATDNALGIAAQESTVPEVTINASITVTQVD